MDEFPTIQDRRTVLKRIGATAAGTSLLGANVAASSPTPVSDILSDPKVQAIEDDVGPLDYGDSTTWTYDPNEHDYNDELQYDHTLYLTKIYTDNGTMYYAEDYTDGTFNVDSAGLMSFSDTSYAAGEIGMETNVLVGDSDGSTYFGRTATEYEVSLGEDHIDYEEVSGFLYSDDSIHYPAGPSDGTIEDIYEDTSDGGGGGGGGSDDPKLESTTLDELHDVESRGWNTNGKRDEKGRFRPVDYSSHVHTYFGHCSPAGQTITNIASAIISVAATWAMVIWAPPATPAAALLTGSGLNWGLTGISIVQATLCAE